MNPVSLTAPFALVETSFAVSSFWTLAVQREDGNWAWSNDVPKSITFRDLDWTVKGEIKFPPAP